MQPLLSTNRPILTSKPHPYTRETPIECKRKTLQNTSLSFECFKLMTCQCLKHMPLHSPCLCTYHTLQKGVDKQWTLPNYMVLVVFQLKCHQDSISNLYAAWVVGFHVLNTLYTVFNQYIGILRGFCCW